MGIWACVPEDQDESRKFVDANLVMTRLGKTGSAFLQVGKGVKGRGKEEEMQE